MDREQFIQKAMRGEEVVLDDVLHSQAEKELQSIKAEATERVEAERQQKEADEFRESQFSEMVELAAEAKRILAQESENESLKNEALRKFAEKEIDLRNRYQRVYSQFSQIYHHLSGEAFDFRRLSNPVLNELKNRGADLMNLEFDLTSRPLSPMAQQIAEERFRGRA